MTAEYQIFVRDSNLQRIAEVSDFERLNVVTRFNAPGTWTLEVPFGSQAATLIASFSRGIEIVRNGEPFLSGSVIGLDRGWGPETDVVVASGADDTVWLQRRLALPVTTGPPYSASSHDVRTGNAETVMREYVDNNAGPSAKAERRVPGLVLATNGNRGSTITGRARFDNLLALVSFLALGGGDLGFRVVQVGTMLEFQVYEPEDRTASALFSPDLGNLEAFAENRKAGEANYLIVAGQGEGTARTFEEKGDSNSITTFGRVEGFLDRRDTNVAAELIKAADEGLLRAAEERAVALSPVDTAAITFGADYGLGDRVTVMVDGIPFQQLIREVAIALTPDEGEIIRPMVGTPGATVTLEALVESPHPEPEVEVTEGDAPPEEPEVVLAGGLTSEAEQHAARVLALRQLELDRLLKR